MPYPEYMCTPLREDLTSVGFQELKTTQDVNTTLPNSKGTILVAINSVCGCAAGSARPGIKLAVQHGKRPDKLVTVFAGQDLEATAEARKYLLPNPPSSPSIALFKDGNLVHFISRQDIEGRGADMIAENLKTAFEKFC